MAGKLLVAAIACGVLLLSAPAHAQIDLTGSWASRMHEDWMERCCGRDLVDYTGLPLNDEARALALRYSPTSYAMRERQCLLHSPYSFQFWPHGLRIWNETDATGRIIAWRFSSVLEREGLTIWMDGRPHPSPNEFYPFSGFTTGRWEGDTLTTYTTHLKQTFTRRGNGSPLYFDAQSGLLLRRAFYLTTAAGPSPFQMDFDDYRESGGVRMPFLIRMNPAGPRTELGTTSTLRITKVQNNVTLDAGRFARPQPRQRPATD